jgi:hypothetical protein
MTFLLAVAPILTETRNQKRREDAHALLKLSQNTTDASMNFARSALGVRCVFASLSFFTDAQYFDGIDYA